MPHQDPPKAEVLRVAFAKVAHDLGFVQYDDDDGVHLRGDGVLIAIAGDAFDVLARRFAAYPPPPANAPSPQALAGTLARYALYVGHMQASPRPLGTTSGGQSERAVQSLLAAYALTLFSAFAFHARHIVKPQEADTSALAEVIRSERQRDAEAFTHHLLGLGHPAIPIDRRARARLFISTPLTRLPVEAHDPMNKRVLAIRKLAYHGGFVIVEPDPMLTRNTIAAPDRAEVLAESEQDLIAQSDLVVCLGCDVDSWGQSRTVAWAEKAGAAVVAVGDFNPVASRILTASSHRTRHLTGTFEESIGDLQTWLLRNTSRALAHAARRTAAHVRIQPHIQAALSALEALDPRSSDSGDVPLARAKEIVRNPAILKSCSQIERDALLALLGPAGTALFDAADKKATRADRQPDRPRALTKAALVDLDSATELSGWDKTQRLELIYKFVESPVPSTHRPFTPTSDVEGWIQLHRSFAENCSCRACR